MSKSKSKSKGKSKSKPESAAAEAGEGKFSKGDRAQVVAGESGWGNSKGTVTRVAGGMVTMQLDGGRSPEVEIAAADLRKLPVNPVRG